MAVDRIRIATRESPLALWQAEYVKSTLLALYPTLRVELIGMTTRGDVILDSPLSKIGGKALFVIWSLYTPREGNWPVFRFDRFGKWLY